MHRLLQRQLRQAAQESAEGGIDYDLLIRLVNQAYEEYDSERRLTGRAHQLLGGELQVLNARLRDAIAHIGAGLAIWDAGGRLLMCNDRLREVYAGCEQLLRPGADYAALLRHQIATGLVDLDGMDAETWVAARLAHRRNPTSPMEIRLSNGCILSVREERTSEDGVVELVDDITAIKRNESELLRAKEEAELANRAKTEFLTNMSHELRTPLNAIIGFSDIMASGIFGPLQNERYGEYVRDIGASAQHLLQIINDILDLSKIEAGQLLLHEEYFSPARASQSCLRIIEDRASRMGLSVRSDIPYDLPQLWGDQRMFKQVMINLLSNAIKFTPRGGAVRLSGGLLADGSLMIQVQDTGIGMQADEIGMAFQPFRQVDPAMNRRYEGSGLGLSICRGLIEAHGGDIRIESTPSRGTTVSLIFPAYRVEMRALSSL